MRNLKLHKTLREFVAEHNGVWNHEQWLELVNKCKEFNIEDATLGMMLENERKEYLFEKEIEKRMESKEARAWKTSKILEKERELKLKENELLQIFEELKKRQKAIEEKEKELEKKSKEIENNTKLKIFIQDIENLKGDEIKLRKESRELLHMLKERIKLILKKERDLENMRFSLEIKELELAEREAELMRRELKQKLIDT